MEKEKKEYVAPEMEVVELKHQAFLCYSGETGFVFPHEQNPIA